jgi:formate dehydrogenase
MALTASCRLINKETIGWLKPNCFIVNTARGAICVAQDVADALKAGKINGYAGDVWYPQPAPKDHPWRDMRNPLGGGNGMVSPEVDAQVSLTARKVAHMSGTTLDAQKRYADGTKVILDNFFNNKPQDPANLIVENGQYATKGALKSCFALSSPMPSLR